MAFTSDWTTWLLLFGALALLGYIVSVNMKTRKAAPVAAEAAAPGAHASEGDTSGYIARFLKDEEGKTLGESVSVASGRVIVKEGGNTYASLPLDAVKPASDGVGLSLVGSVDWGEARKLGEEWRAKSFKVITYTPDELPPDERAG